MALKFKFTNHDDIDYFFERDHLAGPHEGGFSINNTANTRYYEDIDWEGCPSMSDGRRHVNPASIKFNKIPANGILEEFINVLSHCPFLYNQPTGYEHWVRFDGAILHLEDMPHGEVLGGIRVPKIELPFELID